MATQLPKNKIWNQNNRSDRFGDIWASLGLDLTNDLGVMALSGRTILNVNSDTLSNLGVPCAFTAFLAISRFYWCIAGGRMFYSDGGLNTAFQEDATAGTPTALNSDRSDMEIFNSKLYVAGASTSLFKFDGTWTTVTSKINNAAGMHQLNYFRDTNRLYFVDDNNASIGSINTSDSPATIGQTNTLKDLVDGAGLVGSQISWIKSTSSRIFIGTINLSGNQSKVYAWDGITANKFNEQYTLEANGSLSCVIKDDVPIIVDTRGRLLQLNGGTFTEIARLPFEKDTPRAYDANATLRLVHYNGMTLDDGKINILFNTQLYDTNSTNKENIPSGVWEYTKETGLYHKRSLGLSTSGGTIVDYGQQKLNLVGALFGVEAPTVNVTQGSTNGTLLIGASYFTDATSTLNGIFYDDTNDTLQKAGAITTSKLYSSAVQDVWQKAFLLHRVLLSATDIIDIKYRTSETASQEITITWTGTNSFTTSTDLTGNVGDEVEGLQGQGSGECSHIVTAILQGGVYHVELDNVLTAKSGTAKVRIQSWIKLGSVITQEDDFKELLIDKGISTWIQLKWWMLFTGKDRINNMILVNKIYKKLE